MGMSPSLPPSQPHPHFILSPEVKTGPRKEEAEIRGANYKLGRRSVQTPPDISTQCTEKSRTQ